MEWLLLVVGLLLILGTGFFVAVEFSLVALDQSSVQEAVDAGDTKATALLQCLKSLSTQLSSCQLGITITTLLTGYVMEPSVGKLLRGPLESMGFAESAAPISLITAMVLATLLSMVIGELVPKNLAIAKAYEIGRAVAGPQLVFTAVFKPAIVVLNGFSNKILHLFGLEVKEEISGARSPAELVSLVRRSAEMGTLDKDAALFVDRTVRFSERSAADVMTPRIQMETIEHTAHVQEVIELAKETGYSRFPVTDGSSDEIKGVCHVKTIIAIPRDKRAGKEVGENKTPVIFVPETVHLDTLLVQLRSANLQMAIVLDEYGGTAGMVTLEDLIEEIVGEVADEHDTATEEVQQLPDGSWKIPGMSRPDQLNDLIGEVEIPDDAAYETLGGFVMAELGRIPFLKDVVEIPGGTFTVTALDKRRVAELHFVPRPPSNPRAASASSPDEASENQR
ncbi:hemolysin family protein [Paeniglutamicibacter terrestris]|jgi:CBS domain containing-hemolysin-like protein|uniref:HlyC/CorC family transporter n=1 Tax=Paeniglutamicibacter terrestris TaxID=2723403 RepID=A0ABX1G4F0_9MICC|nr:hemolysin family protein [Paeniglutamicibacter terrestris]ASN39785.1 hypothetical protein CGQ24_12685 [Arthrobacter sp. 7749]NKG20450.1 HlyC/CorC family transporter [Paeniglutamicibacter terrestris]